ncbi:hypothetical protein ABT115_08940 [Streptomyces sp. NPDC001832]|uniref:hypothetical protein n=1 Tax=Streptomyces sp. NPDC001832 TaxID=3154527 RepID=UPI00331AA4CF
MPSSALPWYLKGILYVALPAACLAALYLSIPGEVALAKTAGWSEHYAPAMPVCLSVYALSAGAIATYRRKMRLPGQMTALLGSLMALILAMSAQSISHLIEQSYMTTSALLVVAVSCVPPLTIAHLVHMAETPSQVKTADEEKAELRGMIDYLSEELTTSLASQSLTLVSRASAVVRELESLTKVTEEASEKVEKESESVEDILTGEEKAQHDEESKTRRKHLALARSIQETRESLEARGTTVTVADVCKALGISQATYYRYKPSEKVTASTLPLPA